MHPFAAPTFCRAVACIADDFRIAATISSLVGGPGEYVCVLHGPRMGRHDHQAEVARRCNAVAKTGTTLTVMAGLSRAACRAIGRLRRDHSAVTINSVDVALRQFGVSDRANASEGPVRCLSSEVGQGLLIAKRTGRVLFVDDHAPPLRIQPTQNKAEHLVVVDDHDGIAQVIAANYAFSIGADLRLIPECADTLREQIYQELDDQTAQRGTDRGDRAKRSLALIRGSLESTLQFGKYAFVTFITRGMPYGYFYRAAPSTHLFSYPQLGELIAAGIFWADRRPSCLNAVLVDSGDFPTSETPVVRCSLENEGIQVTPLVGAQATPELVRLSLEVYPHDLFFICSHCGEAPGWRVTLRVRGDDDADHIMEVEEVQHITDLSFHDEPDHVEVHQFLRPISVDGVAWGDAPSATKRHFARVHEILRVPARAKADILARHEVPHVAHCVSIQLRGGAIALSLINLIDVQTAPIIFNNSCVSYYDAAQALTFAGARAYVGTLTPVDSEGAQQLAELIFQEPVKRMSLPLALWSAQRRVFADPDERTYVHVGCHFCRIVPPGGSQQEVAAAVRARVEEARDHWIQAEGRTNESLKSSVRAFAKFLSTMLTASSGGAPLESGRS